MKDIVQIIISLNTVNYLRPIIYGNLFAYFKVRGCVSEPRSLAYKLTFQEDAAHLS